MQRGLRLSREFKAAEGKLPFLNAQDLEAVKVIIKQLAKTDRQWGKFKLGE
jgi:hypothetical protein